MALHWDDLKVLLAVARAGSMARAGTMLRIDQSTVGRRLAALEGALGTPLFVRDKTGVTPNQVGTRLVAHAAEVERLIDRMAEEAAREARPQGTVRLLGNAWVLERLADIALGPFLRDYPGIQLRLIARPPKVAVQSDPTLSLWFEAEPRAGETSIRLGLVRYGLFTRPGLAADALGWVSFFDEDAPERMPFRAMERARRTDTAPLRLTGTDARLLLAAIRAGAGKGMLPLCLGEEAGLQRVEGPAFSRELHLHTHPDTVRSLRAQATVAWLRESFDTVFGSAATRQAG